MRWAFAVLVLAAAIVYTVARRGGDQTCQVCARSSHEHSRVLAASGGRRMVFCCLACALSQRRQSGTPIQLTRVPDYLTGQPVDPARAYAVSGSDVIPCAQHQPRVDQDKQPVAVQFDRCRPSILAFAQRREALAFVREHGGRVQPFTELSESLTR